ncbi:hypothetical protein AU15_22335 [Marinobacter salarius]|uniref:Uncharacterized protein n=1 Tax=Marinobacter salarius TaxID=1420917 RepID=W5YWQ8_9GAMM|nr:hypothetical protein AU15_22335 [Marinobacter salarius]
MLEYLRFSAWQAILMAALALLAFVEDLWLLGISTLHMMLIYSIW